MDVEWITIGRILKPHGVRGQVRVLPLTDRPDRFDTLTDAWLETAGGGHRSVHIEQCRPHGSLLLLKLRSIDDPERAATLRGLYLQVHPSETAPLPEGEYFVFELIGYRVVKEDGGRIGELRDVLAMPAHDVFVVESPRGEILIPAVRDVVMRIDRAEKQVVIRPIPGLVD